MIRVLEIGLAAAFLYFFQRALYRKYWNRNLYVQLNFTSPEIFEGESGSLQEIITNAKQLPLNMLKVKFQTDRNLIFDSAKGSRTTDQFYRNDIFQINGGEKITRTLSFIGGKRGYYQIRNVDLIGSDLLMTENMYLSLEAESGIYVFPRLYRDKAFERSLQQLNGEILTKRHMLEDPFEFRGIREYQPCDDMRSINWKATAKTGELKVNQKNYTSLRAVRIFLNLEDSGLFKEAESIETCLQIGAGLSSFFLEQGIQVSFYCNGADCLTDGYTQIPAGAGKGQLNTIYRALARIDTQKKPADFRKTFGAILFSGAESTITCFVSPNPNPDFLALLEQFQKRGQDFIWYCPATERETPQIPAALQAKTRILPVH